MQYPNIAELALNLASTHGMLNRTTTNEAIVALAMKAVEAEGVDTADVRVLEAWLGTLTDEQKLTLADGEEEEMAALVATSPTSETSGMCVAQLVDDIYNVLVEEA